MIQGETTTGRSAGTSGGGGSQAMSSRLRGYLGTWKNYTQEEKDLLAKYELGFSAALQAQCGNITTHTDEINKALGDYWTQYGLEKKYRARYREKRKKLGKGARRYKRKYRTAEELKTEALDRAREEQQTLYSEYVPLEWQSPKMGKAPGIPGVTPEESRGVQPQVQATTSRETAGGLKAATTSPEVQVLQQEKRGLQRRLSAFREEMAARYKALTTIQQQRFKTLRQNIDEAIKEAGGYETHLHERDK